MPTKDKQRGTWTGVIQRRGLPLTKKRGFPTKTAASKWEKEALDALLHPQETPTAFSSACTQYLDWCQGRRGHNTYRQKTFIVRSLISSIQYDPPVTSITRAMVERYLDSRLESSGGKAANRDLRELSTMFRWLMDRGLIGFNPCAGIEQYQETPFVRYVPPPEDINAVLLKALPWEYDFIQCVYHTAARRIEIQRLTWDDVNFQAGTIRLWTRKRRGSSLEPDELRLNSVLQSILERRYRERDRESMFVFCSSTGDQIDSTTLAQVMPRLCREAGVKPFGFHAIRHFVTAVLSDSKLALVDIQRQLRHKRATTTDIYLRSIRATGKTAADILENSQKKAAQPIHQPTQKKKAGSDDS